MTAVLPIGLFLVALFVAPQLWVPGLLGWPVDYMIYPLWLLVLMLRGRASEVFKFKAQDWFFVAMLAWVVLGSVIKGPAARFTDILLDYAKWFFLYRMTAASIESPERLRQVGWLILLCAGLISVEAIQHLGSSDGLGWAGQSHAWINEGAKEIGIENRTRWVGIFDGPGVFCVMFTVALPFATQFLASAYAVPMRLVVLGTFVPLLGMAIFSTGSRGGYLTAIAILGFWILARFKVSFGKLVLAGIVAAAGLMLGPAYLTATKDSNKSAQGRVEMWAEGIEMVQQNPVLGIGKGKFVAYTGKLIAHNSGIEVMGETGFVGLLLWFGITYTGMKNLIRRYAESPDPREQELLLAIGLCVIGYFVSSLFVTLEYETLYFVLGLTASVQNWATTPATFTKRDFKIMAAIAGGFFVFIKLFVMAY
ncbi:MAG: O-antigen ligase family protein [Burkholderiaceae bacterium]